MVPDRQTAAAAAAHAVYARTDAIAAELTAALDRRPEPEQPGPRVVEITFWHTGQNGPQRQPPHDQRTALGGDRRQLHRAALRAAGRPDGPPPGGRGRLLLLLHGPAGTGKTTLLRALALAWRPWCSVQYVTDAARFLDDSGYVTEVMLSDDDEGTDRWRLVIAEDCGKLLRGGGSGDALSALLNLGDGMLGQGRKLLFALTTNDERGALDAKLTRPGRCLASLDVPPLSPGEAARWLGHPLPDGAGPTWPACTSYGAAAPSRARASLLLSSGGTYEHRARPGILGSPRGAGPQRGGARRGAADDPGRTWHGGHDAAGRAAPGRRCAAA